MIRSLLGVTLLTTVLGAGCTPSFVTHLGPAESLREQLQDDNRYAAAPAVYLLLEDRYLLYVKPNEPAYHQHQHHVRVLLRSEAAFQKFEEVSIWLAGKSRLIGLEARTISPRGEVTPVDARNVYSAEASDPRARLHARAHVFRFPRVEVGSILEYVSTVQDDGPFNELVVQVAQDLPVHRYRAEVQLTWPVLYALRAYGFEVPVNKIPGAEGDRLLFQVDGVPAIAKEDYRLPPEQSEAHWAFRVTNYQASTVTIPVNSDWAHAMRVWVNETYGNSALVRGFHPQVPLDGCDGPTCVIKRVVDFVRDQTDYAGASAQWRVRPLTEVLSSKSANQFEKALLTWQLLAQTHVTAHLAAIARDGTQFVDRDFPTPLAFDYLLVYLPPQIAYPDGLWIDPACEDCAAGQVSSWLKHEHALTFWRDAGDFDEGSANAQWLTMGRTSSPGKREIHRYAAQLDEGGDLSVKLDEEWLGDDAAQARLVVRTADPAKLREHSEASARARASSARIDSDGQYACDKHSARCAHTMQLTLPGYATPDNDRLLLPLDIFLSSWDQRFHAIVRKGPIYLRDDESSVEELRLTLPAGFTVAESPQPAQRSSDLVGLRIDVGREGDDVLIVRRTIDLHAGEYPVSAYVRLHEIMRQYAALRKQLIVLRKKTVPQP